MKYFNELNAGERFFATKISEPLQNCLQLEITIPQVGDEVDVMVTDTHSLRGRHVTYDTQSPRFSVTFENYIAYAVINESYDSGDSSIVVVKGKYFRICENSNFLNYLTKDTFASAEYPAPFKHYQFLGQNHIINVASTEEPIIVKINSPEK